METKEEVRRPAIFFDRDGTLNVDTGYLYQPEAFRWIEDAPDALRWANDHGYLAVVVTNQSGVARGLYTEADVKKLHRWMNKRLGESGAHIDAFYYCPHHPEGTVAKYRKTCDCRKPGTALVEEACRALHIDKRASFLIGDADRDMECAARAGMRGIKYEGGSLLTALLRGVGCDEHGR